MATVIHLLKTLFFLVTSLLITFFSIAVIRAILVEKGNAPFECNVSEDDYISGDTDLFGRLTRAVTFKTITLGPKNYDKNELAEFINFLTESYPNVHSSPLIKREVINNYSLLYTIQGSDPSLKPYLLSGHMDVVPVEETDWEVPPFSGQIKDGYIFGRGTIDAKDIVLGILEALEVLIKKGFHPQRPFFLAFGHDEEGGGVDGAFHIGHVLSSRAVKLEYLLDEGTFVLNNSVPGINAPVAMISVSEKGSLTMKLTVKGSVGHSSVPPIETAIVVLAKALARLPGDVFPSMLGKGSEEAFFQALAPYASFPYKIAYSNLWLFNSVIAWRMGKSNILNALIRTTTAVTMVSGGVKENVLPSFASAVINLRVHPAQTIEEAIEFVRDVISDHRVQINVLSSFPPHPVSPHSDTNFGYMTIKNSIRQIYPESVVVPITLVGNTDSKWYLNLTRSVYRFSPVNMKIGETSRFHGHNEKIGLHNYVQLVNFYKHLIKNSDEKILQLKHSHDGEL